MSNCSTTTTTTCYPCQNQADCDCPNGVVDAGCVQYTGDDLVNFDINSGDFLDDILAKLDQFLFSETPFTANSTNSIVATAGGTNGHSPQYNVRIDPDGDNALTVSALGLMVDTNSFGDGKVKVDAADPKDYLEDQLDQGTDGIITITPTTIGGVIYMVPSIDIAALLGYIKIHHTDLLCEIVQQCIPEYGECVGYILTNQSAADLNYSYLDCDKVVTGPFTLTQDQTSAVFCAIQGSIQTNHDIYQLSIVEDYTCPTTTTTTSTTTTSTSTTTTTTMAEVTFIVQNKTQAFYNTTTYFKDEISSIFYVVDVSGNGQTSTYYFNPTSASAELTLFYPLPSDFGVLVRRNGIDVHNSLENYGTFVLPGVDITGGCTIEVILYQSEFYSTSTTTTTTGA